LKESDFRAKSAADVGLDGSDGRAIQDHVQNKKGRQLLG
jgi:hypothetical protein